MAKIAQQLTELIGSTPLLQLNKFSAQKGISTPLIAKVEYFNPGGSVKDRIALAMIEDAEQKGILKPGATIIELFPVSQRLYRFKLITLVKSFERQVPVSDDINISCSVNAFLDLFVIISAVFCRIVAPYVFHAYPPLLRIFLLVCKL